MKRRHWIKTTARSGGTYTVASICGGRLSCWPTAAVAAAASLSLGLVTAGARPGQAELSRARPGQAGPGWALRLLQRSSQQGTEADLHPSLPWAYSSCTKTHKRADHEPHS